MKKIYIKHNSFFGLRTRNTKNVKNFINGLKLILDDDNKLNQFSNIGFQKHLTCDTY